MHRGCCMARDPRPTRTGVRMGAALESRGPAAQRTSRLLQGILWGMRRAATMQGSGPTTSVYLALMQTQAQKHSYSPRRTRQEVLHKVVVYCMARNIRT